MTINRFAETMVINLSLTGGNGLYLAENREKLSPDRRVVIVDKNTGEVCIAG